MTNEKFIFKKLALIIFRGHLFLGLVKKIYFKKLVLKFLELIYF